MLFLLSYILSVAIGLAITIMCIWSLWGVAIAETSVESQDFEYYRRVAKERGEVCLIEPRRSVIPLSNANSFRNSSTRMILGSSCFLSWFGDQLIHTCRRRRNLEIFFNIGPQGLYPWWTLLLPFRALPYTDGTSWARLDGDVGLGFRPGEEVVTDEDDDE